MIDLLYRLLENIGYYHPVHPVFVHLPIGTIVATVTFSVIGLFWNKQRMALVVYYCTAFAFISLFFSIFFGITDWQRYFASAWLFPIKAKMILSGVLLILLFLATLLGYPKKDTNAIGTTFLVLSLLSLIAVAGLGYYGANLVYTTRGPEITTSELREGQQVFRVNCASCHPQGGNIINPSLPLRGSPQLKSYESFRDYLNKPTMPDGSKGAMPVFSSNQISDEQMRKLYGYVTKGLDRRSNSSSDN